MWPVLQRFGRALLSQSAALLPEKDKLTLARHVLLGIFLQTLLVGIAHMTSPEKAKPLLEIAKSTFAPLVTLILGYYFAKR